MSGLGLEVIVPYEEGLSFDLPVYIPSAQFHYEFEGRPRTARRDKPGEPCPAPFRLLLEPQGDFGVVACFGFADGP